ncbi:hypothetical protein Mgra_00003197 [Meloidogyne graminicola]|uniref:DUF7027 domain-containing protein n=1 Tax=Meloidogyne graminicola TaxID=189291 RepID=A0A8S9ZWL5_9BILA|nr:hypothetical protein Mgra_00003197 [Meloidogyne graminicola]
MLEFDPNNEKWQCCCFRITIGLQIMGIVEAICSSAVIPFSLNQMSENAQLGQNNFVVFYASLTFVTLLTILTSILMVIGVKKRKEKLLYPTIISRIFGVSIGVVRHENINELENIKINSNNFKRGKTKISGRKIASQEEASTTLKLSKFF